MRNICHICTDVRDVFNIEADRRFPDNDERHYRYICQDCLANIILGSDYKFKQEAKIAGLEAQVQRWRTFSSVSWTVRHSVADELEEKIKTKNVGLPINPMIYAIHIKPSIERLRGKVPEQYNYDTPAKPATDHEEVASDSYIQKQREKKSNA